MKSREHSHVGGQVTSQGDGANLGGIGDRQSLPDTPWNTSDQVVEQELNQRSARGEHRDEDQADHRDETGEHGVLVSETFGDETVDEETDDLATVGGLRGAAEEIGVIRFSLTGRRYGEE